MCWGFFMPTFSPEKNPGIARIEVNRQCLTCRLTLPQPSQRQVLSIHYKIIVKKFGY
jgi:hypothetical protein